MDEELNALEEENQVLEEELQDAHQKIEELEAQKKALSEVNKDLHKRIKELEKHYPEQQALGVTRALVEVNHDEYGHRGYYSHDMLLKFAAELRKQVKDL